MKIKLLIAILIFLFLVFSAELMLLFRKSGTTINSLNPFPTPSSAQQSFSQLKGGIITPTPIPTSTPLLGPGVYACDPTGTCKDYSDENRSKYCKVTFADHNCLGECADKSKLCTN